LTEIATMKKDSILFKRVDKPTDRKFKFEGFCPHCNKIRYFRWHGGSIRTTTYRCMKCGYIVTEEDHYENE
jgi:predicted RNA-binding Zn-ribbon protein involved in translation (DUF1610 family)